MTCGLLGEHGRSLDSSSCAVDREDGRAVGGEVYDLLVLELALLGGVEIRDGCDVVQRLRTKRSVCSRLLDRSVWQSIAELGKFCDLVVVDGADLERLAEVFNLLLEDQRPLLRADLQQLPSELVASRVLDAAGDDLLVSELYRFLLARR